MRNPFKLKPRSSFDTVQASRAYARSARDFDYFWGYGLSFLGTIEGLAVISRITDQDPDTPVSLPRIAWFAGEVLAGQLFCIRAEKAGARANESWEDFAFARKAEQDKQRPPAEEPSRSPEAEEATAQPQAEVVNQPGQADQPSQQPLPPADPKEPDNQ